MQLRIETGQFSFSLKDVLCINLSVFSVAASGLDRCSLLQHLALAGALCYGIWRWPVLSAAASGVDGPVCSSTGVGRCSLRTLHASRLPFMAHEVSKVEKQQANDTSSLNFIHLLDGEEEAGISSQRREKTFLGSLIGCLRDQFSEDLSTAESSARAATNDQIARIAVDTAAALPRLKSIGAGLLRASALINPNDSLASNSIGFGANFVEGVLLNKVAHFATPESIISKHIGRTFQNRFVAEATSHLIAGGAFGTVRTACDLSNWTDKSGHVTAQSLEDGTLRTLQATATGALINVPAGLFGSRIAGLSNSVADKNSPTSARLFAGAVSGYSSGALFGGIDAILAGKDYRAVMSSMNASGWVGAATGLAGASLENRNPFKLFRESSRPKPVLIETPDKVHSTRQKVIDIPHAEHSERAKATLLDGAGPEMKSVGEIPKAGTTATVEAAPIIDTAPAVERTATPQHETHSNELRARAPEIDIFPEITDPVERQHLTQVVETLANKFNVRSMQAAEFASIFERFQGPQRELALAIMQHCLPNTSEAGLIGRIETLRPPKPQASKEGNVISIARDQVPDAPLFAINPDSCGNLLGYLYRKINYNSMRMHNFDHLEARIRAGDTPQTITVLDDLSSTNISAQQKQILSGVERIKLMDLGAFEKGVNFIDMAQGVREVRGKLAGLVREAAAIKSSDPSLTTAQAVDRIFHGAVDKAAQELGPNVEIIRPIARKGSVDSQTLPAANRPENMPEDVAALWSDYSQDRWSKQALASQFKPNFYATPEQRAMLGRVLTEAVTYNSLHDTVQKAMRMGASLQYEPSMEYKEPLLVLGLDDGGSSHMMSYIFGKVNKLPAENYTTIEALQSRGKTPFGKVPMYVDDMAYSGDDAVTARKTTLRPFDKEGVIIGLLSGAYEKGHRRLTSLAAPEDSGMVLLMPELHFGIFSPSNKFYAGLSPTERPQLESLLYAEDGSWGKIGATHIWPYMSPDNAIHFVSMFARGALKLPGS